MAAVPRGLLPKSVYVVKMVWQEEKSLLEDSVGSVECPCIPPSIIRNKVITGVEFGLDDIGERLRLRNLTHILGHLDDKLLVIVVLELFRLSCRFFGYPKRKRNVYTYVVGLNYRLRLGISRINVDRTARELAKTYKFSV
jgi:hypothetical protein